MDLGDWLETVNRYNPEFKKIAMDRELMEMNRSKALIEADTESDRFSAELSYLASLSDIQDDLLGYYTDLFDTLYSVRIEELSMQIAETKVENEKDSHKRTEELFQAGRVSEETAAETRIALLEAETELYRIRSDKEEVRRYYHHVTGMEWDFELLHDDTLLRWVPDPSLRLENDVDYRRAEIALNNARTLLSNLPDNAPPFTRKKTELQVENARLQLEAAEFNARPRYENIVRSITVQRKKIEAAVERLRLEEKKLQDSRARYESSLISREQYRSRQIAQLSAERLYWETMNQYSQLLIGAIVGAGNLPVRCYEKRVDCRLPLSAGRRFSLRRGRYSFADLWKPDGAKPLLPKGFASK